MEVKKSEKASLENKKLTYLLLGFIFVLSLCYVALEWTKDELTIHEAQQEQEVAQEMDDILSTEEEEPEPEPEPEKIEEPEEIIKDLDNIIVQENDVTVESNADLFDQKEEEWVPEQEVEQVVEEEVQDEEVFVVVEKMPEFPGGQAALFKYLSENVKYPVIAQENGIQGRVICQFTVNKDGSIVDVEVARSGGDASLDKEAVRVIKSMPKWSPGQQRGKPVRVKYTVPVNFKLQ